MPSMGLKFAALSTLRTTRDPRAPEILRTIRPSQMRGFLRWLDQSGVALYLWWRLRQRRDIDAVPAFLREALELRVQWNRIRTTAMLAEFRSVSEAFTLRRIPHAFLKGFTLAPKFCPEPELRHQADLDVLISPEWTNQARTVILDCGYSRERKRPTGENHFSAPLTRIPSLDDNIYALSHPKELELHTSAWESAENDHVHLEPPADSLDRARAREIYGVRFTSLSQEDAFLLHTTHLFRHLLGSWARLAWFWEVDHFIATHTDDARLWLAIRESAGHDPHLRNAVGLILRLTNRLFASPIPRTLAYWCVEPLPVPLSCWIENFGIRWALSDISGSKLSLFVHKEFFSAQERWRAYLWRRLALFKGRPSLGENESQDSITRSQFRIRQRLFHAERAAYHLRSLFSFSVNALRWKFALLHANSRRWKPLKQANHVSATEGS